MLEVQEKRSPILRWIWVTVLILIIVWLLIYFITPKNPDISPQTAIDKSLNNTDATQSYEYSIKVNTVIDGKKQLASDVSGEKQDSAHIHFKGQIYEAEVDFYLFDKDTYNKDMVSGEWVKISNYQLNQQDIFLQELNPVASLRYKELSAVKFLGTETLNGRNVWVYSASPVISNPYMTLLWTNFRYKLWVEPGNFLIHKAIVTAVSKNNVKDEFNLQVEFSNFNKAIVIKPPI